MYPVDAFVARGGRLAGLHALGFRSERVEIPIPVFILEHPSAGIVLVDPILGLIAYWLVNRDAPYRELIDERAKVARSLQAVGVGESSA